jgi:glycosyltransferase involved in cell wall biosynthesis
MISDHPYLTIIIPCYNEQQNLTSGVLGEVAKFLATQKFTYEVIISDDASTDQSRELIKEFIKDHPNFRLLENEHGGKAFALKHGLDAAQGEYVLFTDMDQSTPLSELNKLLPFTKKGFQVIIGSRGKIRVDFSLLRKAASTSFRLVRKSFLLSNLDDTQCGFKLAQTKAAQHLFNSMKIFDQTANAQGWVVAAWDVEFLFLAEKYGYNIKEVPVKWSDRDVSTTKNRSTTKFAKESLDMLQQIIRVRRNEAQGLYS